MTLLLSCRRIEDDFMHNSNGRRSAPGPGETAGEAPEREASRDGQRHAGQSQVGDEEESGPLW